MNKLTPFPGLLNGHVLKILAIVTMTIDHVGYALYPQFRWLRIIGRFAFPIFAFMVVEGYLHTKNLKKYMVRLLIAAVISEPFFDQMIGHEWWWKSNQNVMWTLLIGLLCIFLMEKASLRLMPYRMSALSLAIPAAGAWFARLIHTDYRHYGVLLIVLFYIARQERIYQVIAGSVIQLWMGGLQVWALMSFVPILMYNGKRRHVPKLVQWLFYLYYPAHIAVICMIRFFRNARLLF